MARLILDSTVLVDVERGAQTLDRIIMDRDDVAIAAVTAAELWLGMELSSARHRDGRRAFVDEVLSILPVEVYDLDVARAHAALLAHTWRTGRQRGGRDLIIAATAVARRREVVSDDESGFADLPGVSLRPQSQAD